MSLEHNTREATWNKMMQEEGERQESWLAAWAEHGVGVWVDSEMLRQREDSEWRRWETKVRVVSPALLPPLTSGWFEGREFAGGRDSCVRDSCEGQATYLSLGYCPDHLSGCQEKDQWQEEAQERAAEELMMQQNKRRAEADVWLKEQENFRRCAPPASMCARDNRARLQFASCAAC
jgi:hypothetical protein